MLSLREIIALFAVTYTTGIILTIVGIVIGLLINKYNKKEW